MKNTPAVDWPGFIFELVMQLGFVAVVFALAVWIWPDDLLTLPLASYSLQIVGLAVSAVLVFIVGLLMAYFVLVEPFLLILRASRKA